MKFNFKLLLLSLLLALNVSAGLTTGGAAAGGSGPWTSADITDGTLVSGDLSANAGLVGSQIANGTLTSNDLSSAAGLVGSQITDGTIASADLSASLTVSGDFTLSNGNLVLASGKGIDFSAYSNNAGMTGELLNGYEMGTFTPTIYGTGSAGTGTYTSQAGFYTRIGRMVQILIYLNWSNHTGTTNMNVGGLPFTAAAGLAYAGFAGTNANIAMTAGNYLVAYVNAGTTTIELNQAPTGGGSSTGIPIDTSAVLIISGTYIQ